jgi:hypothetical protein
MGTKEAPEQSTSKITDFTDPYEGSAPKDQETEQQKQQRESREQGQKQAQKQEKAEA